MAVSVMAPVTFSPDVTAFFPIDEASNVALGANITVAFSDPIW